ncbi:MAG: death-on-curing protein [Verrucomicrobiales bacterium]|jgi:death-on-curing protein
MLVHLSSDAVLAIHEQVLMAHGGSAGLRDKPLLLSALSAPQATFGGEPIMTDPVEVAAAYLYYLCNNHPFVDGNKRTALASCLVFLSENDRLPTEKLNVDEWEKLVLDVAASAIERPATTERLRLLLNA